MKKIISFLSISIILALAIQPAFAAFTDVSPSHENYQAINYLERTGIIQGYSDNTFRPEQTVVRAEAVKIIFAPLFESFEQVIENPCVLFWYI